MKLNDLEKSFKKGTISKPEYIKKMYEVHDYLFEYSEFIKSRDIKKIEITSKGVEVTSKEFGITILCKRKDERTAPIEILNFGYYEKKDSDMILSLIGDNSTFFDIGGNIGWYSILVSKVKHNVEIYVFEPIKKTYDDLLTNITINNCDYVKPFNIGLSNKIGHEFFYFYEEGSGNASSALLNPDRNNKQFKCQVDTLDNFVASKNLKTLDFIKCDVEGAEFHVLEGGVNTIIRFRPIIFTEMLRKWTAKFDYHPNKIIDFLKNLEYRCFVSEVGRLKEFYEMNDITEETNYFFLHDKKHSNLISKFII